MVAGDHFRDKSNIYVYRNGEIRSLKDGEEHGKGANQKNFGYIGAVV